MPLTDADLARIEGKQHQAFLGWYGSIILARWAEVPVVDITDDHELLERSFRAGWTWGEAMENADLRELREAVGPFAALAELLKDDDEDYWITWQQRGQAEYGLQVADLRRLAACLPKGE